MQSSNNYPKVSLKLKLHSK